MYSCAKLVWLAFDSIYIYTLRYSYNSYSLYTVEFGSYPGNNNNKLIGLATNHLSVSLIH